MADTAKVLVAKAILTRVEAATQRTKETQQQELREQAHALFAEQAKLVIDGLTAASVRMAEQKRSMRDQWLVYVVTACVTFALTLAVLWPLAAWTGGWQP